MDAFSVATAVIGLVGFALQLVTTAAGMVDKTVTTLDEAADELKKLQGDLEDLQSQMIDIHATLQVLASNTKDRGFKKLLRNENGNTALAKLCIALEETSVLLKRLTDQTAAHESTLHSISSPNDPKSLAFVLAVLKHTLAPSEITNLVKGLRDMRSEIQMCSRKLDTAYQHSWRLYTATSNGLARVTTNESTFSTSTTLTARIKLVGWLKDREGTWGISRQRNGAITIEQVTKGDHVVPNTLNSNEGEDPKLANIALQVGRYVIETPERILVNSFHNSPGGISTFLHKSVKSVAHIGSMHRKQALSAIRMCHQLENMDLHAETPLQVKEAIMIQAQEIVRATYHAVQVASDPTKPVEVTEQELANIVPQLDRCIKENAKHIFIDSVKNLHDEVIRFENAKKQDQESLQEAQKLANKVLIVVPKVEKTGKEHDFYIPERSKPSIQQIIFHLDKNAKLPEIVWRFQRKYRQWYPRTRVSNPHFYPEVTSLHLDRGVISPLSDYNERWARVITVIGDDLNSRFKLEDSDSFVMYVYEPIKNPTASSESYFFKDTKARLYPPHMLDSDIRRSPDGLVYYFWDEEDKSFVKTYKVRTIGELVKALNIPAETKDEIRRRAREKLRASSLETTISSGTSHAAPSPSMIPPRNDSLTSIEASPDSRGTNSDIVLDPPSQTTIPTSEPSSTPNLLSGLPSAPVQSNVSHASSGDYTGRNTITLRGHPLVSVGG